MIDNMNDISFEEFKLENSIPINVTEELRNELELRNNIDVDKEIENFLKREYEFYKENSVKQYE